MADTSSIEWTDATWNPITGCTLVSEGCRNCYAADLAATRLKNHPSRKGLAVKNADGVAKFTGRVRFNKQWLDQPLRWKRPRMIFVCAHGDLFHEDVRDAWIDRVFAVMALCPQHIFQVLTKRPQRMRRYVQELVDEVAQWERLGDAASHHVGNDAYEKAGEAPWPLPNVWLGTSVEDDDTMRSRIPWLIETPAAVRFVSAEPLLGPIDLTCIDINGDSEMDALNPVPWAEEVARWDDDPEEIAGWLEWYGLSDVPTGGNMHPTIDWVIVGGESGKNARPMHPDWARSLRDQCAAADVPFFFKQWGSWSPCQMIEEDEFGELSAAYPMQGCCDPDTHDGDFECRFWEDGQWVYWTDLEDFPAVGARCIGKQAAGRLLDGETHDGVPGPSHD